MTPLIQAPSVIPQIILSLCTVLIATCNKLFENMTLFNGDHKDTKIIGTGNGKNFYWKIDTGSAVTCMNINAFETAFGKTKERNLNDFKTDIFIRKRKCTHTVQIAGKSSENILGIDFLQKFRLHVNTKTEAYLPNQDSPGGLCANLAQRNDQGKIQIISHASRQLKENEKNYTRFLLKTAPAAWGMDNFNEYLNGSRFTLYRDTSAKTALGTTQVKTLNRLQTTMNEHDFETKDR
jgi:RNase H-like domain found in reverse transcriptase